MQLVVDAMDNAASWSAVGPDGVAPSTELQLSDDLTHPRFGLDARSVRLAGSNAAFDHRMVRGLPNLDLSNLDELRIWVWSSRTAAGSTDQPFFLEVRLASAAVTLTSPGNTWLRYVRLMEPQTWELVRMSLSDLPPAIRGAVSRMQIRCMDASESFVCYLDDVLAIRDEMITDVDTALMTALDGRLTLDGALIPAVLFVAENPQVPAVPYLRLTQYDIQLATERDIRTQSRTDFGPSGFQLRPASVAYDLFYEVDAFADTRAHQTRMLEFVLRSLGPTSQLVVNGVGLAVEWVPVDPLDLTGKLRGDRPLLHFRVKTRQEVGVVLPATPPFHDINVNLDQKAVA